MTQILEKPSTPPALPNGAAEEVPEGSHFAKAHHILLFFLAAVLGVWLLSGFYKVNADEIAIVERLGQYVSTPDGKAIQVEQGLHYHLPWPIDRVHKISVQQTKTESIDVFDSSPAEYADFKAELQRQRWPAEVISAVFDPYLITADKSVVHMNISVIYRINDPEAWLNTISHSADEELPNDLRHLFFQQIAERAMINQVSHMTLEQVLFSDLQSLPLSMFTEMQKAVQIPDRHGKIELGVQIQKVEIVRVRPPDRVKSAFDEVIQMRLKRETDISTAKADADSITTQAKGQQTTLVLDAETYRKQTVESARGESDRFKQVLVQFESAPDVTRWNIFVDAVRTVASAAKRIVFAQPGQRTILTVDPPQYDAGQVQPRQ